VVGFKMAMIDRRHPGFKPDKTEADKIQAKLVAAVEEHPVEETQLLFLRRGVLWITCANEFSEACFCEQLMMLGSFGRVRSGL
jgi:hypothetical protein